VVVLAALGSVELVSDPGTAVVVGAVVVVVVAVFAAHERQASRLPRRRHPPGARPRLRRSFTNGRCGSPS